MSKRNVHSVFFCLIVLAACSKKPEPMIAEPAIEFVSISPGTVKEFSDSISIQLSYKDGDGDLGENSSSVKNVFITDNRINATYELRIPQLAPSTAQVAIQGKVTVVLKNTIITDSTASSEKVRYSLYVKDRSGHSSNTIQTTEITVVK